ncbi:MAG: hypothetical protein ACTHLW_19560 [Verrucomicrobiota bacterium]
MESRFPLTVLLALLLLGCKPKETTLAGQVFVVTKDAQNIKLGLIEVHLISKQEAVAFLEKETLSNKAGIAKRQQKLTNATMNFEAATTSANFLVTNGPLSQPDYIALNLIKERIVQRVTAAEEETARIKLMRPSAARDALHNMNSRELESISLELLSSRESLDKLDEIESAAKAEFQRLLDKAKEKESELSAAKADFERFPSGKDYLANFFPRDIQKTLTDADGKFCLIYRSDPALTIFAKGERQIGLERETYFWIVDAPLKEESATILLSNQNSVYSDPDGYFKIKPVVSSSLTPE